VPKRGTSSGKCGINDITRDPTFSAWDSLRRILNHPKVHDVLTSQESQELQKEFDFLCHFLKRIKFPREKAKKTACSPEKAHPEKKTTTKLTRISTPSLRRSYGNILHYLEEREWRIVLKKSRKSTWPKTAIENSNNHTPDWFLPYEPGKDLFTIVFPDNRTLAKAMECDFIREKVFPKNKPPVTLLSLDEVGTF
jgi:hypothetical protein